MVDGSTVCERRGQFVPSGSSNTGDVDVVVRRSDCVSLLLVRGRHLHHLLADVVPGEEPEEGVGGVF